MADEKKINRRRFLKRGAVLGGAALGGSVLTLSGPAMWKAAAEMINGPRVPINGVGIDDPMVVKLSLNENPFGASRHVIEAVSRRMFGMNRYPFHNRLEEALSEHLRMPENYILTGGGSTEILNLAVLSALYENGGNTITGQPSYYDIPSRTARLGGTVKRIPTNKDWGLNLDAMKAAIDENTRIINICNPNNPTGQILDPDALERFIRDVPEQILVLVDEAYIEFAGESYRSMIPLTTQVENLVVARTFSKAYGLAGVRVGYGVGQPALLERLMKFRIDGANKSMLSIEAAIVALQDQNHVRYSVDMVRKGREYLYPELEAMGHEPVHTETIFIPVKVDGIGEWLMGQLYIRDVHITRARGMDGHIRISVGQPHENEALIAAMKDAGGSLF
jgi:histidinol-phosphate aminotransferase